MESRQLTLAFLAGCLNKQEGIRKESLYHARLKESLTERFKVDLDVNLMSYYAYNQVCPKIERFLRNKQTDILIFFIRPFPFMVLNKPVIKYDNSRHQKVRGIHPAFLSFGKYQWPEEYSKYISEGTPATNGKRSYSVFEEINLVLGMCIGLHHWSKRYVEGELDKLVSLCSNAGTRMIVLGIPPIAGSPVGNFVCQSLNRYLIRKASRQKLDYIDVFTDKKYNGEAIINVDGRHFTETGHAFLESMLNPVITGIIRETLNKGIIPGQFPPVLTS
jgi:hypothetical protein